MFSLKYYTIFSIDEPLFIAGKVKEILEKNEAEYLKLFAVSVKNISSSYQGNFEALSTAKFYKFIQDMLNILPEDKRNQLEIYVEDKKVNNLSTELIEYYRDLKAGLGYFSINFYFDKENNFYYMKLGVFPAIVDLF